MRLKFSQQSVCFGLFLCCVAVHVTVSCVGLGNNLFEIHAFRQYQTALTTQAIQERGWSLAYPTPLFGPPWSVPMEFPFYEVCVAKFAVLLGIPLENAGRLVSLAFFYSALPACFGMAGILGIPRARRWLLLAGILFTPGYIYYSRSFMIESTALSAALWFLWSYCRGLEQRSFRWLAAAGLFGALAALAKVTTFFVILVAAAIFTLALLRRQLRAREKGWPLTALSGIAATLPAIIVGVVWVRFSDAVKAGNPLAAEFTSSRLSQFNFGTWSQRISADFWQRIHFNTSIAILPDPNLWLVVVFGLLLARTQRIQILLLLLGFIVGPLVFANLYFVHDYYFYANGMFLAAALAITWNQLLDTSHFTPAAKWAVISLSLATQFTAFFTNYFPTQRHTLGPSPELGILLREITAPDDVLLIVGQEWEASVPYVAHRRAIMIIGSKIDDQAAIDDVLKRVPPGGVTALIASGPIRSHTAYLKPYIERLKLHPEALLVNANTAVYVAETRLKSAKATLAETPPASFKSAASEIAGDAGIPRMRAIPSDVDDKRVFTLMNQLPLAIYHPYGVATGDLEGTLVLNTHAPTDLVFAVPPKATTMEARFGILPAAYTGGNHTAGVEFRIEWVAPDRARRVLGSVFLDPERIPGDRPERSLSVTIPSGANGELWFRVLPGPTGSIACAWAYLKRINIR